MSEQLLNLLQGHAPRIENANTILPMTTVTAAGRYLLSTPVEFEPNAGPQAPPIAGATQERRLLAVACRPMLGSAPRRPQPCPHPRPEATGRRPSAGSGADSPEGAIWNRHGCLAGLVWSVVGPWLWWGAAIGPPGLGELPPARRASHSVCGMVFVCLMRVLWADACWSRLWAPRR